MCITQLVFTKKKKKMRALHCVMFFCLVIFFWIAQHCFTIRISHGKVRIITDSIKQWGTVTLKLKPCNNNKIIVMFFFI